MMLARPDAERQWADMSQLREECAAMAADMLDDELIAIINRIQGGKLTPLQRAVFAEVEKRQLNRSAA
jgi:hypothetical protein